MNLYEALKTIVQPYLLNHPLTAYSLFRWGKNETLIMSSQLTHLLDAEFILKSYILQRIQAVFPKYTYPGECGVNPAFQSIKDVKHGLGLNEKRIFALRSDFVLATGVKNAEQRHGYYGLKETFTQEQYPYLNWQDRYGHPSLAIAENDYDGAVFYAGFICQRSDYLEVFLSSGRYNRYHREDEGILPLNEEEIYVIESYLTLFFQEAYGTQNVLFYDTTPEEDEKDSALFFTNTTVLESKAYRLYTAASIAKAVAIANSDIGYSKAQDYIQRYIPSVKPKYSYPNEGCINPGYLDIAQVKSPLILHEKRIWVLRGDLVLATGIKNAYEKEHGYTGFKEGFSESVYSFINWSDRYGHPSLTVPEDEYDGSAFYAGYICQRKGYLQVYLVSGRFERTDLTPEQVHIIEAYIAAQFQVAYGIQSIVFDYGNSDIPTYHATFFKSGIFDAANPQRRYDQSAIRTILQNVPLPANENAFELNYFNVS